MHTSNQQYGPTLDSKAFQLGLIILGFIITTAFFAVLFGSQNVGHSATIDLAKHIDGTQTGNNYQFIIDNEQAYSIENIIDSDAWQTPEKGITNRGFQVKTSWMRFILENSSNFDRTAILEYVDPAIDDLKLYYREVGKTEPFKLKSFHYNHPSMSRDVSFYRPAFHLPIAAESQYDIYIQFIAGNQFPMHSFTAMRVWNEKHFHRNTHEELALMMFLFCTEIFMGFASLILFYLNKDTVFLYYSFFVFSAASLFASFSGIWAYFIQPGGYELWMVVLQISICQIAALLFVRRFLETKKHLPLIDKFIQVVILVDVFGVILNLMGQPYLSRVIIDFTAIGYFALIPVGLIAQRKGVDNALLFTGSWIVFVIGMALASLRLRGYIPDSWTAQWLIYIGGIIEIFLLATIMVLYIKRLQSEKIVAELQYRNTLEDAAEKLTKKVNEQTQQLIFAKEKAENEARIDVLTGLYNRRAFLETAQQSIARHARDSEKDLFLALFDIDHFKRVNDTYGHQIGDHVLTWIAKTASNTLREIDIISRIGGEEFALLLESDNKQTVHEVCDRLLKTIADTTIRINDLSINVTASIGLARYHSSMTLDELIQIADKALYTAKQQGRNQVVFA